MSLLKSKKDKALERHWYEKLREQGFEDCEDTTKRDRPLKQWDSFKMPAKNATQRQASTDYYEAALKLAQMRRFESLVYRRIWELHCLGMTEREIERAIKNSRFRRKYSRDGIHWIIKKIAKDLF